MCNRVAVPILEQVEETFKATVLYPEKYKHYYHVNTWDKPLLPTIHIDDHKVINLDPWETSKGFDTYNARNDQVFDNMHKEKIFTDRVLVLVSGFFEYRKVNGKSYPYFIRLKHGKPFAMGGLINRFNKLSIITTDPNETMATIHNQAKRMPLILPEELQYKWLEPDLLEDEIDDLMQPCSDEIMQYHTINKIPQKPELNNKPETLNEFKYPELEGMLF